MLILTRRLTETLVIGDSVTLTVLDIKGSRVRIGVNAPRHVVVKREESFHKAAAGHRMPDSSP
jgi:carbon storage regulator